MSDFSNNLKYYRLIKNMEQKELAKQLSISKQTISHWETGYTEPSIQQLIELADIFETTIDELVGRTL